MIPQRIFWNEFYRDLYQIKREALFLLCLVIVLAAVIGQYFTIIEFGWKKWYYFWNDHDGNFTLKWYMNNAAQDVVWCIFVAIYWYFMTKSRIKEHRIQELLAINESIDKTDVILELKSETIEITGESKESLTVSPSEILCVLITDMLNRLLSYETFLGYKPIS